MSERNPTTVPTVPYYAVVDFEATCWPNQSRRGDSEIIQIGAVRMRTRSGKILDSFSSLVRPTRYPQLSELCTGLTGITQQMANQAPSFADVHPLFAEWIGDPATITFCSWGAYDHFLLMAVCRFHRLEYPFADRYINIKPAFSHRYMGRGTSMPRALDVLGLQPQGKAHNALDDAMNVARIWREIILGGEPL